MAAGAQGATVSPALLDEALVGALHRKGRWRILRRIFTGYSAPMADLTTL